jgi:exodeoxyribonuclease V gamma subunit
MLEDSLGGLRAAAAAPAHWLELVPSRLCSKTRKGAPRIEGLLAAWVRTLAASACGLEVGGVIVGRDACLRVRPWPRERARDALVVLMQAWHDGLHGAGAPLPLAPRTAWAWMHDAGAAATVYDGSGFDHGAPPERNEACLARVFPDHAALVADGRFETLAQALFGPLAEWVHDQVQLERHADAAASVGEGAAHG